MIFPGDRNAEQLKSEVAREGRDAFQHKIGPLGLAVFCAFRELAALPRRLLTIGRRRAAISVDFQIPWLPRWPNLAARPVHDPGDHDWVKLLRDAAPVIREELRAVLGSFELSRYGWNHPKPWTLYYLFFEGRPVREHLAACPRTAEVLSRLPHNAFHVGFSAIEPGGSLLPHTGPTNASLTAHLGLDGCDGARLHVADQVVEYRNDDVLVFDDSYVHWVQHHGSQRRYTLMVTFWHPELAWNERLFLSCVVRLAPGT